MKDAPRGAQGLWFQTLFCFPHPPARLFQSPISLALAAPLSCGLQHGAQSLSQCIIVGHNLSSLPACLPHVPQSLRALRCAVFSAAHKEHSYLCLRTPSPQCFLLLVLRSSCSILTPSQYLLSASACGSFSLAQLIRCRHYAPFIFMFLLPSIRPGKTSFSLKC